jgi:flagellar L-ring protein FlgH
MHGHLRMVLAILTLALGAGVGSAGSIWDKTGRQARSMYADDTARQVGDTLTMQINEQSIVDNTTSRSLSKNSSREISTTGEADLRDMVSLVRGDDAFRFPEISYDSSSDSAFDGQAEFDTNRSVVDQVTVAVEDVLPNGNLVVLGTRHREVDGEEQIVQVSGIVRPSDIDFENQVPSQRVADFRLVVTLNGSDNTATRVGWYDRIFNWINPF